MTFPRPGGIQSYLQQFVDRLACDARHQLTVCAAVEDEFDRDAPVPGGASPRNADAARASVDRRMRRLIADEAIETVWFGAAALLRCWRIGPGRPAPRESSPAPRPRSRRWSMLLRRARSALRRIGDTTDVVTFVSKVHPRAIRVGVRAAGGWSTFPGSTPNSLSRS